MSAEPENTGTPRAEPEHNSPEEQSITLSEAEPPAEPLPEWSTAVKVWGAAWEFHQYGLGAVFGIMSVLALVSFIKIYKNSKGNRQKKVSLVVLGQITIFGLSRCLFLFIDAYHSRKTLPNIVLNIVWGVGQPCLITAFTLIFVVLRNALVLKQKFQNWYTTRNIAFVTVPYFAFALVAEIVVSLIPAYKGLLFACQLLYILLNLSLASFYIFLSFLIWTKLRQVRKGTSNLGERGQQTSSILKRCVAAVVGGFSLAAMQIYALVGVYGVFSDARYVSPWPWFAFNTTLRCLEIGMSILLYMTGTQKTAQKKRQVDVAPATLMLNVPQKQDELDSETSKTEVYTIDQNSTQSTIVNESGQQIQSSSKIMLVAD